MKNIVLTSMIVLASLLGSFAQSVVGDWKGSLDVQGNTLEVIFHISEASGEYLSTMDSPNQGAFGIEMDKTTVEGNTLNIKAAKLGLNLEAEYKADADQISGTFNQGPMSLPLELARIGNEVKDEPTNDHPLAGSWNGLLNAMDSKLRLVLNITENNGELSSTLDSPDQGAFGIPMDEITVDGDNVTFSAKKMGMNTKLVYNKEKNELTGKFAQGPINEDITFTREEIAKPEVNRPQEPKTFDYKQEDVKFTNPKGGHSLAGTLTTPKSGEFDKVVVLVSGSGPQDRNEELIGHKPFLVLSDHLTRNGIAVLRYDDRGVGESTGKFSTGTSMDFADDATAAVDYLKTRPEMKGKQMGVMGHSEGGLIAPIVTTKTDLDFIVLLAGPGTDSDDLLLEQTEAILLASGENKDDVKNNLVSSEMIFDYMNANPDMPLDELKEGMRGILVERFKLLPKEDLEEIGDVDTEINNQIETVTTPWFRYFLNYKPSDYLTQVTIPVLAVNGSLDLQVLPKSNLSAIDKYLKKAGNKNYTIKEFEGLNHLFQVSEDGTGSPNEYGKLEETFNKEAMMYITEWLNTLDK